MDALLTSVFLRTLTCLFELKTLGQGQMKRSIPQSSIQTVHPPMTGMLNYSATYRLLSRIPQSRMQCRTSPRGVLKLQSHLATKNAKKRNDEGDIKKSVIQTAHDGCVVSSKVMPTCLCGSISIITFLYRSLFLISSKRN